MLLTMLLLQCVFGLEFVKLILVKLYVKENNFNLSVSERNFFVEKYSCEKLSIHFMR